MSEICHQMGFFLIFSWSALGPSASETWRRKTTLNHQRAGFCAQNPYYQTTRLLWVLGRMFYLSSYKTKQNDNNIFVYSSSGVSLWKKHISQCSQALSKSRVRQSQGLTHFQLIEEKKTVKDNGQFSSSQPVVQCNLNLIVLRWN